MTWKVTDDITGKEFNRTNKMTVRLSFKDPNGTNYYANFDTSPEGYQKLHSIMHNKPQWAKQIKNTEEQEVETGKKFSYRPTSIAGILDELIAQEVKA
jgi:hypothetical protein